MSGIQNAVIHASGKISGCGLGMPVSLANVAGRSLISWQIETLESCRNLVVIVGYQASHVMRAVLNKRPDAIFVMDHDYENSPPLDSLLFGTSTMNEPFVYIRGDVLVDHSSVEAVTMSPWPVLGIKRTQTEQSVCVDVKEGRFGKQVTGFTREPRDYEWTGLAQLNPEPLREAKGLQQVTEAIQKILPISAVEVDSRELKDREDLEDAECWLSERYSLRQAVIA